MQDMLVKLYDLPDFRALAQEMEAENILIRPALAAEKSIVADWVRQHFGEGWASEVEVCFSYQPVSCFIAIHQKQILGFGAYDCAYRNFFGPTGVKESERGRGIGKILLMRCLEAMRTQGYGYAIIGGVGPAEFYAKAVGATLIKGSNPGVYRELLSKVPEEAEG